jgi:hypothetical protein
MAHGRPGASSDVIFSFKLIQQQQQKIFGNSTPFRVQALKSSIRLSVQQRQMLKIMPMSSMTRTPPASANK